MKELLQKKLSALHRSEGGAVFLLLLAAFLILFMVSLVLYDTTIAAGDKMAVQISADTAAYSHSVVKARSMNTIVYANIIKRMYYSYMSTYTNGWAALLANLAYAWSKCRWYRITACIEGVDMALLIVLEGIEFFVTNKDTLFTNFSEELLALDTYQRYMHAITPWWAYLESLVRGTQNGALATASWPPPPTKLDSIKTGVSNLGKVTDKLFGSTIMSALPGFTTNVDTLPLARRDKAGKAWIKKMEPFKFSVGGGGIIAGVRYCKDYTLSIEHVLHGIQTYRKSEESGIIEKYSWRKIFFLPLDLVPALGCAAAHMLYKGEGYLDWRIKDEFAQGGGNNATAKNNWAQASSNISIAYRPRAGRQDNAKGRQKYQILSADKYDYNRNILYKNEGYFAMSRAEIVYKKPHKPLSNLSWGGVGGFISSRLGTQYAPDMWSPRWKAKSRPMLVPNETMGSAVEGTDAGLNTIINDTVPLLVLSSSMLGLMDSNFDATSGIQDLFYLVRIGHTFNSSNLQGVPK